MYLIRFLYKYEYVRTLKLFLKCFPGDEDYADELYGELDGNNECTGTIKDHHIVVVENDAGEIISMVHYKFVNAVYGERTVKAAYIMDVATRPDCRRRGFMDKLMNTVIGVLKAKRIPWCFLVAVDKDIYRHLGFIYDWEFNPQEALLLDADDGLKECSARLITDIVFKDPDRLM